MNEFFMGWILGFGTAIFLFLLLDFIEKNML